MIQTISIRGNLYDLNLGKYYLKEAEKHLVNSKTDVNNEQEHLRKAQDLIEKVKFNNLVSHTENSENFILKKKPSTKFSDVVGLEGLKEKIKLKVIGPLKDHKLYELFGKKFGGGIIMYGPPGCGKSFIAEATAGEAEVAFFNVKISDIKGKYVGETEKNISRLFQTARNNQPCIIFFDEFEALGSDRTNSGAHDKSMVSQLLNEIDGLGNKDQQIMLVAATNEPWSIDLALRREGRFGKSLFIPPPDFESRLGILKKHLIGKPIEPEFDFELIAKETNSYSGADLLEICEDAIEKAISESIKTRNLKLIKTQDLIDAIHNKKGLITKKWINKAIDIIYTTNNQDSFKEIIDYVNETEKLMN